MDSVEHYNNLLRLPYLEFHEIAMIIKGYEEPELVPFTPQSQSCAQRECLFLHKKVVGLHKIKLGKLEEDKELSLLKTIFFPPTEKTTYGYQKGTNHLIQGYCDYYRILINPVRVAGPVRDYLEENDLWFVEPLLFFAVYILSGGILPLPIQKFYGIEQPKEIAKNPQPNHIAIHAVGAI